MAVKKLIEVALPLEAINDASIREKSIRHGHPASLHLWWARRPLATARAMIWASLVDDPSSHPELFPTEAEQNEERQRLFSILEKLVVWENSTDEKVLAAAKSEIKKCMGDTLPPLLDPFAGGGAIPFEAQRLGIEAFAQDLNPVAVTINKAMIEVPPRFANMPAVNPDSQRRKHLSTWEGCTGLGADVKYYGNWLIDEAFKRIGKHYPQVDVPANQGGGKSTVIAWIWTRTVKCPNPACGHEAHLARSYDLSKKRGREYHIEPIVANGTVKYTVHPGKSTREGTVTRTGATCIHCHEPITFEYIREEARQGRMGAKLMAMIGEKPRGRVFVGANEQQIEAAEVVIPEDIPTTNLPEQALGFRVQAYGMTKHSDLFSPRQMLALTTLSDLVKEAQDKATMDAALAGMSDDDVSISNGGRGARAYGQAIGIYLAFLIDQVANHSSTICSWNAPNIQMRNTFGRQAIPMVWDYAECNIFSSSTGSYRSLFDRLLKVFPSLSANVCSPAGHARQFDAQSDNGMRDIMVSTDPPYYDNIGYADLSDYFYVWLRRSLRNTYPELFSTMLVPKAEELIATPFRDNRGVEGARAFFEEGMLEAFRKVSTYSRDDVPVTIYYAFKQSETETVNSVESTASTGWETMLTAIIKAGFSITGTWPVRTEKPGRSVSLGTNALASSIVLVCRKRPKDAPMATRRDFVNALKRELRTALGKLQTSNIAPVDLAQSAIGPGIGVYSRFSRVLEANGTEMTVRSALQIINQELDLYFSDQDSDLDRESRFCVDLYTQNAFNEIRFGEADVLARAKNTSIEGIAAKGALSSAKGVVRLLGRDEIRDMPAPDFCWLFTQQLTHEMETGGIEGCAKMLKDIYDGRADNARALAYRLFTIADKKGWNQEAFAYNSLVVAWRDIESRAAQLKQETPIQTALDI